MDLTSRVTTIDFQQNMDSNTWPVRPTIYPKSNGFIESQVKILKKVLKKAQRSNSDPNIALLCLRSTPIDNKLPSPSELPSGWQIQGNLPRKIQNNHTSNEVIHRLPERQASQKLYYDQHTHILLSLTPGDQVTIQNPKTPEWKPAVVTNKAEGTLSSYNVSTENGKELHRNRSQIRQIPQKPSKHVSFGMRNNQLRQFTPNTEHMMAKTTPCQTNHRNSPLLILNRHTV